MAGTKYNTKDELLNAVIALVYPNTTNAVSAANAQTSLLDIVESLWGGSSAMSAVENYTDLTTLIGAEELVPGTVYSYEYQCIHKIPHTSVINTASPNYVEKKETFFARALSTTVLSPIVVSAEHPQDTIIVDFTDNSTENGGPSTPRPGKVIYRKDNDTGNETHYDFRGVYTRRFEINYTAATIDTTFNTGSNADADELIHYASNLHKATRAITGFATSNNSDVVRVDHWSNSLNTHTTRWVPYADFQIANVTLPVLTANFTDSLTLDSGCTGVTIGRTEDNDGYNNVKLIDCQNIVLADGSKDSYLDHATNIYEPLMIENSLYGQCNETSGGELIGTILWDCDDSDIKSVTQSAIWWSNNLTLGPDTNNISFTYVKSSSFGAELEDVAAHNMNFVTVGPGCKFTTFQNVEETTIGAKFGKWATGQVSVNNVRGVSGCAIGDDCGEFDILAVDNSYSIYTNLTIGNNVTGIQAEAGCTFTDTKIGDGCDTILVRAGGTIDATEIGVGCSTIEVDGGSSIQESIIEPGVTGIFLDNGAIRQSTIGMEVANGEGHINLIVDGGSLISSSQLYLQGNYNAYDKVTDNTDFYISAAYVDRLKGGFSRLHIINAPQVVAAVFDISCSLSMSGGVMNGVNAESYVTVDVQGAMHLHRVMIGNTATLTLVDGGNTMRDCIVGQSSDIIIDGLSGTANTAATVTNCVFPTNWKGTIQSTFDNQSFSPSTGTHRTNDVIDKDHADGFPMEITYTDSMAGNSATESVETFDKPAGAVQKLVFYSNVAKTLDKQGLGYNIPYKFMLMSEPTAASNLMTVALFDSGVTVDLTTDKTQVFVEVMRINTTDADGATVDQVVVLNNVTLA